MIHVIIQPSNSLWIVSLSRLNRYTGVILEKLETWKVILIIVAVFGYVIGNIMLLKYANKFNVKDKINKQIKPEQSDEKEKEKEEPK